MSGAEDLLRLHVDHVTLHLQRRILRLEQYRASSNAVASLQGTVGVHQLLQQCVGLHQYNQQIRSTDCA